MQSVHAPSCLELLYYLVLSSLIYVHSSHSHPYPLAMPTGLTFEVVRSSVSVKSRRVLVTGGANGVGSHIVHRFLREGFALPRAIDYCLRFRGIGVRLRY